MKRIPCLLGSVVLLLAVGCASIKVKVDYDRNHNFSGIGSFDWVTPNPAKDRLYRNIQPEMVDQIKRMLRAELARKGLSWNREKPDFYLLFYSEAGGSMSSHSTSGDYNFGVGGTTTPTMVKTFREGSLVFELYDLQTERVIWRGIASGRVEDQNSKTVQKVREAITKVFRQFPPR